MTFKSKPLSFETEERKHFHVLFNEWLNAASDEDYQRLEEAREEFAPNQVCSAISLVTGCLQRQDLERKLPASLRQLLRERSWQPAYAGATAP